MPQTMAKPMQAELSPAELDALEQRLAARAVITDIECHAGRVNLGTELWWDVRPMLDEAEHSPECIDMSREALAYAAGRHLIQHHSQHPHLVRVLAHH